MSLHSLLESVATIFRPTSVTRDANQGVVQVFTMLKENICCSQQQMGASKQLIYAQQNAMVGSVLYFDENPETTANDYIIAISEDTQQPNAYLVAGRSFPKDLGRLWNVDCTQMQTPQFPAMVIQPEATSITDEGAMLVAEVVQDGGCELVTVGFVYSLASVNDSPFLGGTGVFDTISPSPEIGAYSRVLTGLAPESLYRFRPYVITGFGTSYGMLAEFTTLEA